LTFRAKALCLELLKGPSVTEGPFEGSLKSEVTIKVLHSKHRNSPYIFSGSCIPTNKSLFISLALPTLAKTVHLGILQVNGLTR
jgi:hypothetical protein